MSYNLPAIYFALAVINVIGFILVGIDKKRSRKDEERVPEVYLFFISIFFATFGVLAGMFYFRHKTRKIYFPIGLGLLMLEQAVLIFLIWQKLSQNTISY